MINNLKKIKVLNAILISIVVSFILTTSFCLIFAMNPFLFYNTVFLAPFRTIFNFSNFLQSFSFLLLFGATALFTFHYRIYNFAIFGQMIWAMMVAFIIAEYLDSFGLQSHLWTIFLLIVAMVIGACSGALIWFLKKFLHVHETVSSLIFNFLAFTNYSDFLLMKSSNDGKIPHLASLRFDLFDHKIADTYFFSAGIIVAVLGFVIIITIINNRTFGLKLEAAFKNPLLAKQFNLKLDQLIAGILILAGAFSGVCGYLYFLAFNDYLVKVEITSYVNVIGIVAASMCWYDPILIFFSTLFLSFIFHAYEFQVFNVNLEQGLLIILGQINIFVFILTPTILLILEKLHAHLTSNWQQKRIFAMMLNKKRGK